MTEQEKQLRDIDTLRALIEFDVHKLDEIPLSADKRRIIKDHLDALITDLQMLLTLAAPLSAQAEGVKVDSMLNTEVTSTGQPIVLPRGHVRVITSTYSICL